MKTPISLRDASPISGNSSAAQTYIEPQGRRLGRSISETNKKGANFRVVSPQASTKGRVSTLNRTIGDTRRTRVGRETHNSDSTGPQPVGIARR